VGDLVKGRLAARATVVSPNGWKKLGTASLPPAKEVSIERLMTGVETSQRVEITGSAFGHASQDHAGGVRGHRAGAPAAAARRELVVAAWKVRAPRLGLQPRDATHRGEHQRAAGGRVIIEEPEQHPPLITLPRPRRPAVGTSATWRAPT
jgi:hypothetical protein